MACYTPAKAYLSRSGGITFDVSLAYRDVPKEVPCGRCIGCRIDRARSWAVRCVHESKMHSENSFLTLTYDNEHLPVDGSLDKTHFRLFMKRLRKHLGSKNIKFFHCGEYGGKLGRPHYHALIFGHAFYDDRKKYKLTAAGHSLFVSPTLNRLWSHGTAFIGNLTFESAAYCARYSLKKITGDQALSHYAGKQPEYCTMSNRPAIGKAWYDQYASTDVYRHDHVILNGKKLKPPRYYDKLLRRTDPSTYALVKELRVPGAQIKNEPIFKPVSKAVRREKQSNQTPARRAVREQVAIAKSTFFKKALDK